MTLEQQIKVTALSSLAPSIGAATLHLDEVVLLPPDGSLAVGGRKDSVTFWIQDGKIGASSPSRSTRTETWRNKLARSGRTSRPRKDRRNE